MHTNGEKAKPGSIYNVSAGTSQPDLKIVRTILHHLRKPESLMRSVQDRPGHDRRCALDCSKIQRELGWRPEVSFEDGIRRTIEWYQTNGEWLEHARSGEYRNYYERHYTCVQRHSASKQRSANQWQPAYHRETLEPDAMSPDFARKNLSDGVKRIG